MRYEIKGDTLPVVVCYLENGERMITERGSMSWMSRNMKMYTTSNGKNIQKAGAAHRGCHGLLPAPSLAKKRLHPFTGTGVCVSSYLPLAASRSQTFFKARTGSS